MAGLGDESRLPLMASGAAAVFSGVRGAEPRMDKSTNYGGTAGREEDLLVSLSMEARSCIGLTHGQAKMQGACVPACQKLNWGFTGPFCDLFGLLRERETNGRINQRTVLN